MSLDDEIHSLNMIFAQSQGFMPFSMRELIGRIRTCEGDALVAARSELAERWRLQLAHKRTMIEYERRAAVTAPDERRRDHAWDLCRHRLALLAPCYKVIAAGHKRRLKRLGEVPI